jgi:hypothetical protein
MLWKGPWNFLYSYFYYQKNWLNILIDDPLSSNITKLEPKKKKKKPMANFIKEFQSTLNFVKAEVFFLIYIFYIKKLVNKMVK